MLTDLVELADKPSSFDGVDDFYTFIPAYGIPTNFVAIENDNFNERTSSLLNKLKSCSEQQELCQLIDYLIYYKYWLTLDEDLKRNDFKKVLSNYKNRIPIKNKAGEYVLLTDETILLFDDKDAKEHKEYFIEKKTDDHYYDYITVLGVKQPSEFIKEDSWFEKISLYFVEYLYRQYGEQIEDTGSLVLYLKKSLPQMKELFL